MNNKSTSYDFGLVLSGGGAKGFAHVGVLKALDEFGLKPDIIAGTSAGAFAGVLYADGHSPDEIISFFKERKFQEFAEFGIPKAGFFKSTRFHSFLKTHLKARNFDELEIPLRAIATDIEKGEMKVFKRGDLVSSVIASCTVPLVFSPIEIEGSHYVDGGLLKNFPVSVIRKECRLIFGVNVSPIRPSIFKNSMKYVAERAFHYMSSSNTIQDRKSCDYLLESADLTSYSMFDLEHVDEIYQTGYRLAKDYLEENKTKLITDFKLNTK